MRRKYLSVWIGLSCGLLAALFSASGNRSLVSIFLAPWTGLGAWLRSLSQSGSAGNAAAWALCIFLSLLPAAALLPSRKRRKQRSDLLILPVCASAFVCLYLLVNPTLLAPAALREEMKALFSAAPAIAFLSILLAAVLIRWSGRLEERRLFFWLKALIRCVSALTSSAVGYTLASSLSLLWPALHLLQPDGSFYCQRFWPSFRISSSFACWTALFCWQNGSRGDFSLLKPNAPPPHWLRLPGKCSSPPPAVWPEATQSNC